uniref:ARAD1D36542p n=1 Tax=Blastobotrys adeninivorans TaxID=409370 RepID=A0A060TI69_BLAAD
MSTFVLVLARIYHTVCNNRSPLGLVANFFKNFSLVLLWLTLFKNAGLIPTEWRPPIHVTILRDSDAFIFSGFSGVVCGIIIFLASYPIACHLISSAPRNRRLLKEKDYEYGPVDVTGDSIESAVSTSSRTSSPVPETPSSRRSGSAEEDDTSPSSMVSSPVPSYSTSSSWLESVSYALTNFSPSSIAVSSIWVALNLGYLCIDTILRPLDILAWLSYVIGHLVAPIVTAVYLWLFAPPGATACFGLALGLQNLAGVLTHLSFPTAPPWYNHMHGDLPGNYSMPGYAAGLTRVDIALGTHIHSQGFHMSPIVFGAFPSLHSAFVSLIFLFVSRYATWGGRAGWTLTSAREWRSFGRWPIALGTLLASVFMFWQWWSTMYLDHHYRLDLLGGAIYAVTAFYIFLPKLQRAEARFEEGGVTTAGMRLFEGTWFADFFNPLPRSLNDPSTSTHSYFPLNYREVAN